MQERAVAKHKRVQALGGAKNFLIVMPDGVSAPTLEAVMSSAFGGAGQRCLAGSVVLAVSVRVTASHRCWSMRRAICASGAAPIPIRGWVRSSATTRSRAFPGTSTARATPAQRCCSTAARRRRTESFLAPVIFDDVNPNSELATEEIFGPVLAIVRTPSLDRRCDRESVALRQRVVDLHNRQRQRAGSRAHRSRHMISVNIGVAAPMAFFPFGGIKDSIFGDLRCHGKDAVAFYTQQRVVISRWPE